MQPATIRDFILDQDQDILREWIEAVKKHEGANPYRLEKEQTDWVKKSKWRGPPPMSRGSIRRFLEPEKAKRPFGFVRQMGTTWAYLASQPLYARHFHDRKSIGAKVAPSPTYPEHLLAFALENFFCERPGATPRLSMERMQNILAGRFVLYRQDFEPAQRRMEPPERCIRASSIEIWPEGSCLFIKETQDFPKTRKREKHYQVNNGVLFAYGKYVIGIMNVIGFISFKCLTIDFILSAFEAKDVPTEEFRGKMLVASDRASYPSARFVCKRVHGKKEQHGIYPYNAISKDVRAYISTPTLDKKYRTVS